MNEDINAKNRVKKIIKIIFKILYQAIIIVCLILAAVIIMQKITDSNKSIYGYRIFRVITGSMEPEYDVGEVVISKSIAPEDIKVGDDIVYLGKYGEYNGKIIMHNVVQIETDSNGNLNFHAKGLHSSSVEDPLIKADQIYGVVKFKSKILTILYKLATNIYSVFIIITVLVINVFVAFRGEKPKNIQRLSEPSYEEEEIEEIEEIDDDEIEEEPEDDESDDETDDE